MKILSPIARKFHTLTRFIENPRLAVMRWHGVDPSAYEHLTQKWLADQRFATLLDIGANDGKYAFAARAALPEAAIYSFEPLPDCFQQLQKQMAGAKNFYAFNHGLGETAGQLSFERNAFSPSSSFLSMSETHKAAFPFTSQSQTVTVQIERLDEVAAKLNLLEPMLIKIDVQGYEDRVLRGGEQTIKRAKALIIETSFEVLYQEQPLFDQIYALVRSWGFVYAGALDQLCHPEDGRVLQADSIFIRK